MTGGKVGDREICIARQTLCLAVKQPNSCRNIDLVANSNPRRSRRGEEGEGVNREEVQLTQVDQQSFCMDVEGNNVPRLWVHAIDGAIGFL